MTAIKKSSALNGVACGYLWQLLRSIPSMYPQMREMEAHQLGEFELNPQDLASRQALLKLLKTRAAAPKPACLWHNCELLDRQVGEDSPLGLALLRFIAIYTLHPGLRQVIEEAGYADLQGSRLPLLAAMIGYPLEALRHYLSGANWLSEVDFLYREADSVLGVGISMDLLLAEKLQTRTLEKPVELISDVLEEMPPSQLTLKDYGHMQLGALVEHAVMLERQMPLGWNALLWGKPGTGKTQLACLLAGLSNLTLYTLRSEEDARAYSRNGMQSRVGELLLAQRLLGRNGSCMLLVDEGDDLLMSGTIAKNRRHQLLEDNPVPVIWTTNDVASIDAACLRRFNWLQQFEFPNPDTRIRLFTKAVRGLGVTKQQIAHWAERTWLSQADIQRVASLMCTLGLKRKDAADAIEHWLDQRERAFNIESDECSVNPIGKRAGGKSETKEAACTYRMEGEFDAGLLNLRGRDGQLQQDIDIAELMTSLKQSREGRILLHGLPGTGKTALVHHLGKQLGCEVVQRLGSELLHKYVGESEQAMALAFAEARERNAILFLDEVDSLLTDRRSHHQAWETSQVNELLQQIERFDGMLVVVTNFLDRLDTAVARRFDYQLELCPLLPAQLYGALKGCVDKATLRELGSSLLGLGAVTLGDIAVLKRRQRLQRRKLGAAEIQGILKKLIAGRERGNARPIGFLQGSPMVCQG
ncbi:ATP-binding protein [Aeromonas veronii]|uniref:AAA family ATPase n=1 Tax=Aeromonas veronii TaxID=654 RepID=UPI001A8C2BE4|nr:ATP-binding protein [Aeromonas veronii]MBO0398497.1 ATP-binding protein [Aeromonas veronii]